MNRPASADIVIPDKRYFKIGEVCRLTGVKQHVLRYWESEFPIIRPQRAASKQRLYRRVDVENILRIKQLLQEEGFTIAGARRLLARRRKGAAPKPEPAVSGRAADQGQLYRQIKQELYGLKAFLERDGLTPPPVKGK